MSETFGLTGVEIEERKPLRSRVMSQNSIRPKTQDKLPVILSKQSQFQYQTPQKNLILKNIQAIKNQTTTQKGHNQENENRKMKVRSISSQNLPSTKKLENFRRNLETSRTCITSESRRQFMPKSSGSFLKQFESNIKTDLDKLYSSEQLSKIMQNLKITDQKQALNMQLEKNQKLLQKEMNLSNSMQHEIQQKKKQMEQLDQQILNLQKKLDAKTEFSELDSLEMEYQRQKQKIQENSDYLKILNHMLKQRQKQVIFNKNQVNQLFFQLKQINLQKQSAESQTMSEKKSLIQSSRQLRSLTEQGPVTMDSITMGGKFEDMLEKELIEFENHKSVKELFEKERLIQIQKIEMKKQFQIEEYKRKKAEQEQHVKQLENQHAYIDNQLKIQENRFEKLRRISQKQNVKELKNYNKELKNRRENLESMEVEYGKKILSEKKEIEELKIQYKKLKFQEKNNGNQEGDQENKKEIQLLENSSSSKFRLVEIKEEERRGEEYNYGKYKGMTKNLENNLDSYCMSLGRILGQIMYTEQQEGKFKNIDKIKDRYEVGREQIVDKIEEAGKKLEKMFKFIQEMEIKREEQYRGDDEKGKETEQEQLYLEKQEQSEQELQQQQQQQEQQQQISEKKQKGSSCKKSIRFEDQVYKQQQQKDDDQGYDSAQEEEEEFSISKTIISSPPKYLGLQKSNFQKVKESEVMEELDMIKNQYGNINDYFNKNNFKVDQQSKYIETHFDSEEEGEENEYELEYSVRDSNYDSGLYELEEAYEKKQLEEVQSELKLKHKIQLDKAKLIQEKKKEEEENKKFYS